LRLFNLTCQELQEAKCHNIISSRLQDVISVSHIPNNHIVLFNTDYDENGHIDKNIHLLCWQLGGVIRKQNGKIILNNNRESNPKNRQVEELPEKTLIRRILRI